VIYGFENVVLSVKIDLIAQEVCKRTYWHEGVHIKAERENEEAL